MVYLFIGQDKWRHIENSEEKLQRAKKTYDFMTPKGETTSSSSGSTVLEYVFPLDYYDVWFWWNQLCNWRPILQHYVLSLLLFHEAICLCFLVTVKQSNMHFNSRKIQEAVSLSPLLLSLRSDAKNELSLKFMDYIYIWLPYKLYI